MEARAVVGIVLIGLMLPYLSGRVLNPGSFSAVPRYWYQVAAFLAARSPLNTALVVPADAHGEYLWGDPIDDPLVALARSPWAESGLVPYGGAGSQILLETAENAIESGEQVPGLAGYLQRAGIRYVVVRNDLDPQQVGYTSAALVHQTLALCGFTRVASFGPPIGGAQIEPRATRAQQAALPSYPAVEVYAAAGAGPGPPSPVSTLPVSQTVLVNGGPDSLLQLTGQHLLGSGQPAIIAGDPLPASGFRPAQWAVTDGQRRADTLFGLVNNNVSYTYTATETNPPGAGQLGRAGGPPRQLLPVPAAGHQTVAVLSGAASVTASSYGSWIADTQQDDPVNAFDGDPATAWAEGNELTPVGQWIQISFTGQLDLPASIGIRLLDDSTDREIARLLRVSTAAGSATTKVAATGALQPLNVVPGRTRWLRITIAGARRVSLGYPGAGISDVLIPGVRVTRMLQPAQDPAGRQAASTVFSFHQQVPSPFAFADPAATPSMARTFTVASPATLRLQASALAVPGPGLDALLDKISPPGPGVLQVSVASTPGELPPGFPASLISGSAGMPWTAETTSPVIHLSWRGQRRIASLVVRQAAGLPSTPQTVKITSPEGTRQASIGSGGLVRFTTPLTTDRIDVSFPRVRAATVVTPTGQLETLPVRLSRLSVPALAGLRAVTPDEQARFTLACGQGPALTVDGRVYQTSVSGTTGELSQYLPLQVRLCSPGGTLSFGAGRHTLTAATPGTFAVTDLSLASIGPAQDRRRVRRLPRRDHPQLAAGPAPAQHRPGSGLLSGGPRELQPRLGRRAERAGADAGTPRRLAARLHRADGTGRDDHAQLPADRGISPRPGRLDARRRHLARHHGVVLHRPPPPQGRAGRRRRLQPGVAARLVAAASRGRRRFAGRPRARLAGRARRRRADFRGRRPGRARGSVACLPSLAAAAFAPGEDRATIPAHGCPCSPSPAWSHRDCCPPRGRSALACSVLSAGRRKRARSSRWPLR